ncbi:hypothetical protein FACS189494_07950 [Spirochaetia bacterium]|nr:hypothetical protein FACS189494_07950 [Spirochaetia bacterium]
MKTFTKRAALAALIAAVSVLAMSCSTTKDITVDNAVPQEESAVVFFPSTILVQRFNGEDVSKKWNTRYSVRVRIPAGESKIEFDLYDPGHNIRGRVFRAKDLTVIYNFEAAKKYTLTFTTQDGKLGIALYDKLLSGPVDKMTGQFPSSTKPLEFWVIDF